VFGKFLGLLMVLLAGCAAPPTPTPTPRPVIPIPQSCAAASGTHTAHFNLADDYCLLYPAHFRVSNLYSRITSFSGPPLDSSIEPVEGTLTILIEDAAGERTLTQVVDEYLIGLTATRTTITLGGELAEVIEGIPGRSGSRQAFLIHNGAVYHFSAYPVDPAFPQALPDVEAAWQSLLDSFTFLPAGFAESFSDCPAGSDGAAAYLNFDLEICLLYPSLMSLSANLNQLTLSGPARDDGPEAVRVNLLIRAAQPANGRKVKQVAADILTQYPADQRAKVTPAPVTIGGQPGVVLDGLPGQMQNRQTLLVHNDRVYEFILLPYNDPAFTDYQTEAEAAWQTIINTLVFVNRP
jgi:hypothetical protein